MAWKELYVEGGLRTGWLGRILILLLVLLSFVPVVFILREYLSSPHPWNVSSGRRDLAWEMNFWVRWVSTIMACLALLSVAVRAAGSISGERDRHTLDSLLLSPLPTDDILFGKWVGSILSPRWAWVYLGVVWFLAMLCGGLHPLAVPLLITAWFVFAAFFSTLGLWFSTVSRTTLRATIYTIFTAIAVSFGHFLIWACCIPLVFLPGPGSSAPEFLPYLLSFQVFGLTPPAMLAFLAFHGQEFNPSSWGGLGGEPLALVWLICSIIGLFIWALATFMLFEQTRERLRVAAGRGSFRPPYRPNGQDQQRQKSAIAREATLAGDGASPAEPSPDGEGSPRHPPAE
jgi:ABC-type transport system involved in multi-copper enzyme maturation permease subunit